MKATRRVLLVEDDSEILNVMQEVLELENYQVVGAANGAEALARLREAGDVADAPLPDLILADLMMPVMDGWTLIEKLREDAALAKIPVVAMTASGDRFRALPEGVIDVLIKPIEIDELLSKISRCFN